MTKEDITKMTFRTHHGHYEYRVSLLVCAIPLPLFKPQWMTYFNHFYANSQRSSSMTFSSTMNPCRLTSRLELVLKTLLQGKFYLERSKCLFVQWQLEYLGHVISGKGIEPESSKITTMLQWSIPSCQKDLQAFLGLIGFYRRLIKGYAAIASPFTTLLYRDKFHWLPKAQQAFDHLKRAMTKAPILVSLDFSSPFVLETNASGNATGAILMQQSRPIAFFSEQFSVILHQWFHCIPKLIYIHLSLNLSMMGGKN